MIKRIIVVSLALAAALAAGGFAMYYRNTAPVAPPISSAEASSPTRPFVVKLHARWCAVCMITTSVWSQIEKEYSGRVNLLVLDFTDDQTTEASRAAAERVGLGRVFEESGSTGVVLIVDGRTREVIASIAGSRDFDEYRTAIDAALSHRNPAEARRADDTVTPRSADLQVSRGDHDRACGRPSAMMRVSSRSLQSRLPNELRSVRRGTGRLASIRS
jgi:thiol-disulfide isomerase/thioredoxin